MATGVELKREENKVGSLYGLVAYNLSKPKVRIIKFFLKVLGIDFKLEEPYPYGPKFIEKMKRGDEDIKAGRTRVITDIKDLWKIQVDES